MVLAGRKGPFRQHTGQRHTGAHQYPLTSSCCPGQWCDGCCKGNYFVTLRQLWGWKPKSKDCITDLHCFLKTFFFFFLIRGKHFADKGPCSQSCGFPIAMYEYKSWTIRKVQRIDAVKLWCWRRLLRVAWRRSIQSILKEINPEYSLEGLMLKLNFQYFGHLIRRADSLEKTLMLEGLRAKGKRSDRGWDGWMASLTQWTWVWANSRRQWRAGKLCAAVHGVTESNMT